MLPGCPVGVQLIAAPDGVLSKTGASGRGRGGGLLPMLPVLSV
jgi:hypothetical protein